MAASLSRPDPSSPASVAEAGFSTSRRGYNHDEVRAFLTSVAAELGRLQERQRQLEAELHAERSKKSAAVELDDETVASMLGEETLRVLHTARESASEIKIRAEENAARILREANDEANRVRQETEVEAARKRYDASADAEAEVALAKQQGREMVNEARAYRERVLADLERRTTLARHQIEELVHGRDRLLQVFERARLVAVDVTSELQAIEGPDELVNLSPTTGPVPLMVPTGRSDEAPQGAGDDIEAAVPFDGDAGDGAQTELIDIVDAAAERTDEAAAVDSDDDDDVDDEGADEAEVAEANDQQPTRRDANVVSLFRGRAAPDEHSDQTDADAELDDIELPDPEIADAELDDVEVAETGGSDADTPDDAAIGGHDAEARLDVGGIFARLRSEAPADEVTSADTDDAAADVSEATDAVDVDEAETEELLEPTPFTRRDAAIVPLIVAGARKIKRVLADEQNGVLDTLRQNEPVTSLDGLLPEAADHLAIYVDGLAEELTAAAAAGAGELGVKDTKTLHRKLVKSGALDSAHDLLRTDLLRPLRDRLERAITEGAGDNEDITKRVRAVYREWKTQHIDDQLDDIFRFAHGGGLAVSVEPGTPLVWMIDPDHPACPDCEDNSLAGSVAAGESFPTGHVAAPAHPGCRCLTLPDVG